MRLTSLCLHIFLCGVTGGLAMEPYDWAVRGADEHNLCVSGWLSSTETVDLYQGVSNGIYYAKTIRRPLRLVVNPGKDVSLPLAVMIPEYKMSKYGKYKVKASNDTASDFCSATDTSTWAEPVQIDIDGFPAKFLTSAETASVLWFYEEADRLSPDSADIAVRGRLGMCKYYESSSKIIEPDELVRPDDWESLEGIRYTVSEVLYVRLMSRGWHELWGRISNRRIFPVYGNGTQPAISVDPSEPIIATGDTDRWLCKFFNNTAADGTICEEMPDCTWVRPKLITVSGFTQQFITIDGNGTRLVCEWTEIPANRSGCSDPGPAAKPGKDKGDETTTTDLPGLSDPVGMVSAALSDPVGFFTKLLSDPFSIFEFAPEPIKGAFAGLRKRLPLPGQK